MILLGFSRGAFTARSVADLIASVGLLTVKGLELFYHIFEDYENLGDKHRELDTYLWPGLTPYQGEEGKAYIEWTNQRKTLYRGWLKSMGYTRDTYHDPPTSTTNGSEERDRETETETEIRIKGVCVFETVGSLGVPPAPVLGLHGSATQWKFSNTEISDKVEVACQALALDEPRAAFAPALWERMPGNRTALKQVWFPGSHANPGGGWYDQQIATIAMAWMCDQLSGMGVELDYGRMTGYFYEGLQYSAAHPFPAVPSWKPKALQPSVVPWAVSEIFNPSSGVPGKEPETASAAAVTKPTVSKLLVRDAHEVAPREEPHSGPDTPPQRLWADARPWGLGQIRYPNSVLQLAAGVVRRHPGLFRRMDPETNCETDEPLADTGERVHSCVRVRLAARGLGVDDQRVWRCAPLRNAAARGVLAMVEGVEEPLWSLERLRMPAGGAGDGRVTEGRQGQGREGMSFRPRELALPSDVYPRDWLYPIREGDGQYHWVFVGRRVATKSGEMIPPVTALPEEPVVGYWERVLLGMTVGRPDVWRWAEEHPPLQVAAEETA
jgi:hypothetical protein